jgi:hypothetical protein
MTAPVMGAEVEASTMEELHVKVPNFLSQNRGVDFCRYQFSLFKNEKRTNRVKITALSL